MFESLSGRNAFTAMCIVRMGWHDEGEARASDGLRCKKEN